MTKALAILLTLLAGAARAATIAALISPTAFVIRDGEALSVATVPGRPILYCGLAAYAGWGAPLVGRTVTTGPAGVLQLTDGGRQAPLADVLAAAGWLRPPRLSEAAQAAIVERKGGWACAPRVAPFAVFSQQVDPQILAGIALNESSYRGRPWPWTLNVAGRGYYFASREEAYAVVRQLLASKRCDFDVGIMQVNWCYHARRFATPWDALAPAANIRAAEAILLENRQRSGSSVKAVAWYHSADPARGGAYFARFLEHLKGLDAASTL
ncbi:transglycosylase SLT domain-containing protein [Ralstonia nicotianae]|uniref:transglycosylase SLT domain-containing protein n=1 Tax=Ralstonia pseudosolanacearum TaxID=1310165 RepID=UPI00200442F2|nr:transglycosylase SLT domain-containing protein [Ralstonia pseudosolanacearum]MCK4118402.1 lytic transglycosylase domain-containing protein [Ralstonia pseudosolanacearum]